MNQQRKVLEATISLQSANAKSKNSFALTTLQKAIQDIQEQLSNISELLLVAQNKKALVTLPFLFSSTSKFSTQLTHSLYSIAQPSNPRNQ
jgi:hypothetical protein